MKGNTIQILLAILSVLICAGAVVRVWYGEGSILERVDETTLLYLAVAGGILLLREAKAFSFGDYKVEFETIRNIAEEARQTAEIAEDTAKYSTPTSRYENSVLEAVAHEIVSGEYDNDPWKGQFGLSAESNQRRLSATVVPLSGSSEWFSVELKVESLSPRHSPLQGAVRFFLHPTFANDKPIVPVGQNGVAKIKLKAWGAFTVGVLADEGNTKLELDLAELSSAPYDFRMR